MADQEEHPSIFPEAAAAVVELIKIQLPKRGQMVQGRSWVEMVAMGQAREAGPEA
jgi:hypothetical protein